MTGSTLRLALPLAGLLIVAPVEARELGHETVGDFEESGNAGPKVPS
jgi:hypothetical protein